jgi:hypothetical protein
VTTDTSNTEKSIYLIILYITLTGPSLANDETRKQTLIILFFTLPFKMQSYDYFPDINADG